MTGNIRTMDELFSAWEKEHCSENDTSYLSRNIPAQIFLPDGIINPAEFEHSKPKVLFIAKEANWYQSDNDPTKEIDTMFWHREVAYGRVPRTSFSYRLSMLANAIMHSETDNYSVIDKSHDILKSVAFMNLNKRGGYSYCIWETLKSYVCHYQDFIRKQIEIISPDLIVCCGYDVKWLLDEYSLAPLCEKVIWVYHPSYFVISDKDYLQQLKCAMSEEEWHAEKHAETYSSAGTAIKGIIFDTNKTYSSMSTMDMLLNNKVSAYDDAAHLIDSFNTGDYVFLSVKGVGIVAAGRIISDTEERTYSTLYEKYRVVDFISPTALQMPHGESQLKSISWQHVSQTLGHGFFSARTDKRPYLTERECEILVEELMKINK